MMKIIASINTKTPGEFINESSGSLYFYYNYLDVFGREPLDMNDLIDGLLYVEAKNYIKEQAMKKAKEQK